MDSADSQAGVQDLPTEILTPNVTEADVISHLQTCYGLKVTKIKRLNGYDDCNFHVTTADEHSNPYIQAIPNNGYFVKVSNIFDSKQPETLRAQLSIMNHLRQKGVCVQSSVKSLENSDFSDITVKDRRGENSTHKMAVRIYLPGEILNSATLTPHLLYHVGQFVGRIRQALQDFHHPFYDNHDILWGMNNFPRVREVVGVVTDERRRRVCQEVLKAFDDQVVPVKARFTKGQIHGDLNEQNLLVDCIEGTVKVSGLLDFQDSTATHPIYDLSIMAAYMMMSRETSVPRPHMPGYVLAGYSSLLKLNEAERQSFHTLAAARMVMSLVYGAHSFSVDPSNVYLLETAKTGWDALIAYWETPKQELEQEWERIVDTYMPK